MAKNWMDPLEVQRDAVVFQNLMHALLGLYLWEFATSLDFEWAFISGRKRFRWPILFYFLNRYSLLGALIGIAVSLNVTVEVNCQALYTFNSILGNATIGFASINLSLRTMAVWEQKWYIVAPLVAIMIGQWSLLVHGVLLTAVYTPAGCQIIKTESKILAASFIYTMCFDALIMFLTGFKLATTGGISRGQRSRLVDMIFSDGLIYFVIAFVSNTIATTFMLLNLNPIMSIIFNVPSAIASTIVATRAVRRLSNFLSAEPERFGAPKSSLAFRRNGNQTPGAYATGASYAFGTHAGHTADATATAVTVPMETFSQAASKPDHAISYVDDKEDSDFVVADGSDLEAQIESKPRARAL